MAGTNIVRDSTWPDDYTDLSKAVMTTDNGEWFIVPMKYVDTMVSTTCDSVIIHKCPKWTDKLRSKNGLPYEPLGYWTTPGSVELCCALCDVPPPEAIASLWTLHNFDTFANQPSDLTRMVTREISKAWSRGLHGFAIRENKEYPCPCRECQERYGEDR